MKIATKSLTGFIALATLGASAFASEINCTVSYGGYDTPNDKNYSALLVDVVRGTCENGTYDFELSGIGIGLRAAAGTALGFACPFSDKITGTYGGLKVDASVVVGVDAGLFVGKHGICALGGVNGLAAGINLSGSRLVVSDRRQSRNQAVKSQDQDAVALLDQAPAKTAPARDDASASSERQPKSGSDQRQI